MEAVSLIPLDRATRLTLPDELIVAATWEEFLEILPKCEYRLEYSDQQMRSYMGYATEQHEELIARIISLLTQILPEASHSIYGSNLALSPTAGERYYNADVTVVRNKVERRTLRPGIQAITNPTLLVEVLSPSTAAYDLSHKLGVYRNLPSVEQVLYVDSSSQHVQSYRRLPEKDGWLWQVFEDAEDEVPVLNDGTISLVKLYANIKLEA